MKRCSLGFHKRLLFMVLSGLFLLMANCGGEDKSVDNGPVLGGKIPKITILSPADGDAFNQEEITVKGKVDGEQPLSATFNNDPLSLDGNGNFEQQVSFKQPGSMTITIAAQNNNGSDQKDLSLIYDIEPPDIELDLSQRATFQDMNKVTSLVIKGNAKDQDSKIVTVKVNGLPVSVDASGNFQTNLVLKHGSTLIKAEAIDKAGNLSVCTMANIAGRFQAQTAYVPEGLIVHMGKNGIKMLENILMQEFEKLDIKKKLVEASPFQASSDLKITIHKVYYDALNLSIVPMNGYGLIKAEIENLYIDCTIDGVVPVIGSTKWRGWINIGRVLFETTFDVEIEKKTRILKLQVDPVKLEFETFTYDFEDIYNWVENLVKSTVRQKLEDEIKNIIDEQIQSMVKEYNGKPAEISYVQKIDDKEVTLKTQLVDVKFMPDQCHVVGDLAAFRDPALGPFKGKGYLYKPNQSKPQISGDGITVAMSDNGINSLVSAFWEASLLNYLIDGETTQLGGLDLKVQMLGMIQPQIPKLFDPENFLLLDVNTLLPPVVKPIHGNDRNVSAISNEIGLKFTEKIGSGKGKDIFELSLFVDTEANLVIKNSKLDISLVDPKIVAEIISQDSRLPHESETEKRVVNLTSILLPIIESKMKDISIEELLNYIPSEKPDIKIRSGSNEEFLIVSID